MACILYVNGTEQSKWLIDLLTESIKTVKQLYLFSSLKLMCKLYMFSFEKGVANYRVFDSK